MSTRLLQARLAQARLTSTPPSRRLTHTRAGGLLRADAARTLFRRPWPQGALAIHNAGVPAVRTISFIRVLPKLVTKFATLGAVGGGAVVAGLTYVQYRAEREYIFSVEIMSKNGDEENELGCMEVLLLMV